MLLSNTKERLIYDIVVCGVYGWSYLVAVIDGHAREIVGYVRPPKLGQICGKSHGERVSSLFRNIQAGPPKAGDKKADIGIAHFCDNLKDGYTRQHKFNNFSEAIWTVSLCL